METVADRVRALEVAHNAEFRRTPRDGTICAALHFADGTVLTGYGPNTAEAVTSLEHKVARFTAQEETP